ncbi:hypothetical protein [Variovorax paradoxus]|uniref:hypothetical protein n=1 Tax=Variovorax paradoxus TaxID=34073 RepID=UPI000783696D|nr:hypothetical protein [Variovorax paradoxus]
MATKRAKATTPLRRISVYVEEPEAGWFQWVLAEAAEGLSIWHDLNAADEWQPTYREAMAEGLLALQEMIDDLDQGPREEPPEPKKKASAAFGFGFGLPKFGGG